MEPALPLKKTSLPNWTAAQRKFWELLQIEENRDLPVLPLCEKAGYRSFAPWYWALRDPVFRASVEELRGKPLYDYDQVVIPLASNPEEEWHKDSIDLRCLVAEYPKHAGPSTFRLDFSYLHNPRLKALLKRYFRAHIGFWEAATFKHQLQCMKPFLLAFSAQYPEVESFACCTRAMIEPFLTRCTWTDQKGRLRTLSGQRKRRMVISLQSMFTYMQRHGWEEGPRMVLLYAEDCPKYPSYQPRPLPSEVLEQLQAHLHLLPPYARNLVNILSVVGLRAEDAMHLTEDCIDYDAAGDPRLRWYNHKMKREGRLLPITTSVVEAISRQRELVKDIPDHFGKRYVFRTERGLYKFRTFSYHLNKLASQVPILGPDRRIYHFKPHQFRHTVGSQMISGGLGIADVMAYLDHMSPEMTLRYIEINDETLKHKFKALVLSGQAVGGAALKALKEQLEKGDESELDWVVSNLRKLSLPWGQCLHHAKANKCPYGQNVCFTKDNGPCHKLMTTPEHAPVIIATMEDLKKSKQIADEKRWEMYANDLADQIRGMEQILAELQLPADQRSKNRGGVK